MTPTLAQRLALRPARLEGEDRRLLTSARAAVTLFALQPTVALAAAAVHSHITAATLAAALTSYGLAILVLIGYERFGQLAKAVVATAGSLVIAVFVVGQEHGQLYAVLYIGPVLFFCFFFDRRRAIAQVAIMLILTAAGTAVAAGGIVPAAEALVLHLGAFGLAALVAIALRRQLAVALEQAQRARAEMDALFDFAPAGFGLLDSDLRHVRVNDALAEMMELPESAILGRTLPEAAPFNGRVLEALARSVLDTGRPVLGAEIPGSDGQAHHLVSYYPVPGPAGTVGVGTAVTDVSHLKDVERRLEDTNRRLTVLATTDELTGLPNRRMLGDQLDQALARARRSGLAVGVLYLDLDGFKEVNDTLGHAYGDEMLVTIGQRLRSGARETDVVARVGGDEFLILLSDLDVQIARELAASVVERVRVRLAEPITVDALELKVAASIGTAIYPFDARDASGLLAAADAAMYAGKGALTRVA